MGSNGMTVSATANDMERRGSVGDRHAVRSNPDYKAYWRAHGGTPSVAESARLALCAQTEADLQAFPPRLTLLLKLGSTFDTDQSVGFVNWGFSDDHHTFGKHQV